ncbi:aspartate-semialdehyde dehydrogenase [Thermogymnomonas acidicola]|nr:aspartate-semialdehyde dehydrogenase [Thermogymnomonas acidicola]
MSDRLRCAVLGATGLVGQRFCQLLSGHPMFEEPDLYGSERSENERLRDRLKLADRPVSGDLLEKEIKRLDTDVVIREHYDAVFSALPTEVAGQVESRLRNGGVTVFTNASPHRMDPDVPLVVPEVNPEHLRLASNRGSIIANGNCSTIGLVLTLAPLVRFGIERVSVVTMQALSGAGYPGVPSLDALSNIVPYIKNEEEKLRAEPRKMLGRLKSGAIEPWDVEVSPFCTRVPVREGHFEVVEVTFREEQDLPEIVSSMEGFRGLPQEKRLPTAPERPIIVRNEPDRPQPVLDVDAGSPDRARGMAVTVGRLSYGGRRLRYSLLVHNTIRGAAGAAVLLAETYFSGGF